MTALLLAFASMNLCCKYVCLRVFVLEAENTNRQVFHLQKLTFKGNLSYFKVESVLQHPYKTDLGLNAANFYLMNCVFYI